jgi:hypothetical protein
MHVVYRCICDVQRHGEDKSAPWQIRVRRLQAWHRLGEIFYEESQIQPVLIWLCLKIGEGTPAKSKPIYHLLYFPIFLDP